MLNVSLQNYSPRLMTKQQTKTNFSDSINKNDQFLYNRSVNNVSNNNIVFKGYSLPMFEKIDKNLIQGLEHVFGQEFANKPLSEISIPDVFKFIKNDLYANIDLTDIKILKSKELNEVAEGLIEKLDLKVEYERAKNALINPPQWKVEFGHVFTKEHEIESKKKLLLSAFKHTNSYLSDHKLLPLDFLEAIFEHKIFDIDLKEGMKVSLYDENSFGRQFLTEALDGEKKALKNLFLLHSITPSVSVQGKCHYDYVIKFIKDTTNKLKDLNTLKPEKETTKNLAEIEQFLENHPFKI